ncbi:MAG: hypothetical protein WC197_07525 [Candidatus Gastranaerophilaceae bacterium]|jgi:hypothetical protein
MKKIISFLILICFSFFNLDLHKAHAKEELKILDLQIQQANLPAEDEIKTDDAPQQFQQQEQIKQQNIYPVNNNSQSLYLPEYLKDRNNSVDTSSQIQQQEQTPQQNICPINNNTQSPDLPEYLNNQNPEDYYNNNSDNNGTDSTETEEEN